MRQKFIIEKNTMNNKLNIREYAYLDRENKNKLKEREQGTFSMLCEETYEKELILSAIKKGKKGLVSALRTRNMYPILIHAEKIADSVMNLYGAENNLPLELLFDDKESLDLEPAVKRAKSSS